MIYQHAASDRGRNIGERLTAMLEASAPEIIDSPKERLVNEAARMDKTKYQRLQGRRVT